MGLQEQRVLALSCSVGDRFVPHSIHPNLFISKGVAIYESNSERTLDTIHCRYRIKLLSFFESWKGAPFHCISLELAPFFAKQMVNGINGGFRHLASWTGSTSSWWYPKINFQVHILSSRLQDHLISRLRTLAKIPYHPMRDFSKWTHHMHWSFNAIKPIFVFATGDITSKWINNIPFYLSANCNDMLSKQWTLIKITIQDLPEECRCEVCL